MARCRRCGANTNNSNSPCCNNSTRSARCSPTCTINCGWYRRTFSDPPIMPESVTTKGLSSMYLTAQNASADIGEVINLQASVVSGTEIVAQSGGAYLQQGLYDVSFSLTGSPSISATQSVEVVLDGQFVKELKSSVTSTVGHLYNLSSRGLILVNVGGGVLNLINTGASSQDYADVGLVIIKLG